MLEPKQIVIRMPNWLGDAVMAAPMIELVANHWPKARLTLYGIKTVLALFEQDPHVSEFLILDKKQSTQTEIVQLKENKFDCGILLTNSFSSAWLFFKAKIPVRVGFSKDLRGFFLTHSLPYPKEKTVLHHIQLYQTLLSKIGIHKKGDPKLYLSDAELSFADAFLREHQMTPQHILIGVNPSAAFGSSKCWLKERFREVAMKLVENPNIRLIFFGDPTASLLNQEITAGLHHCLNLAGQTSIRQLMALTQKCDLFLTNDSGPMHIACALQTPVVALFGSTSPEATGPYGKGIYLRKKVACSPCFKRECPIDFRCMKAITVDEVYQVLQKQLEKYGKENIYA